MSDKIQYKIFPHQIQVTKLTGVNFIKILRAHFFVQKFIQSQTLSREKLLKRVSYKKCACKMLMKFTPGWFVSVSSAKFEIVIEISKPFNVP